MCSQSFLATNECNNQSKQKQTKLEVVWRRPRLTLRFLSPRCEAVPNKRPHWKWFIAKSLTNASGWGLLFSLLFCTVCISVSKGSENVDKKVY